MSNNTKSGSGSMSQWESEKRVLDNEEHGLEKAETESGDGESEMSLDIEQETDEQDGESDGKGNGEIEKEGRISTEGRINILQRVLSTPRSLAIINRDPGPPPDGGLTAWLQVVVAHLCIFNSNGFTSSYGLFEAYYLSPESGITGGGSSSLWTWPMSIQMFLMLFMATLSGRMYDAGYYRVLLIVGFTLNFLGVFATSYATTYTQILLAQGIAQGLGNGFMLCPSVSNLSTYFVRRRSLAIAFMACGSATGGVVFPLIAQQLLPRIGFPWTVRVMGFVMLANMAVVLALAKSRIPPRKSGPLVEWSAFREAPYVLYVAGIWFVYLGLYFAFSYINLYAKDIISVSTSTSLTILLVFNAVGAPGRILPALLADKIGPLNTLLPCLLTLAFLFFLWLTVATLPSLFAFVVFFGLADAAVQTVAMSGLSHLTKDLRKIGTRVGMAMSILAFAAMGGTPIAGVILDKSGGAFLGTQVFGGAVSLVGVGCLVGARVAETGWVVRRRI